ncbi:MAG: Diguanylate cyclase [Xanthobacteraceae bacterium]|nr:Diguanylate cyclase [Xanthobacteraceae bacterium]
MLTKMRDWWSGEKPVAEPSNGKITLTQVLENNWFELFYQPKIDLKTMRLSSAEALVRARHPTRGLLAPYLFLPDATDAELLVLTERVILTALRDWEDFAASGVPHLKLAVNVPANAFVELPIAQMVREERPSASNWPGMVMEVTEDQVMRDLHIANEVATELKSQNCSLAIDDFGAGYSSLARLRQLPFSELKIDRAYVTDCHTDKTNAGVLETIVEMAHRFGLKTVAEGIETTHESHKLQGLGCHVGQGYLFAKPMAKEQLITMMGRRMAGPAVRAAPQRSGLASLIPGLSKT